jgi:hypothetical protein
MTVLTESRSAEEPAAPTPASEILASIKTRGLVPWLMDQGETPESLRAFWDALQAHTEARPGSCPRSRDGLK